MCTCTKTKKSYTENLWMILSSVFFCILWTRELRIQLVVEFRKMI